MSDVSNSVVNALLKVIQNILSEINELSAQFESRSFRQLEKIANFLT